MRFCPPCQDAQLQTVNLENKYLVMAAPQEVCTWRLSSACARMHVRFPSV